MDIVAGDLTFDQVKEDVVVRLALRKLALDAAKEAFVYTSFIGIEIFLLAFLRVFSRVEGKTIFRVIRSEIGMRFFRVFRSEIGIFGNALFFGFCQRFSFRNPCGSSNVSKKSHYC